MPYTSSPSSPPALTCQKHWPAHLSKTIHQSFCSDGVIRSSRNHPVCQSVEIVIRRDYNRQHPLISGIDDLKDRLNPPVCRCLFSEIVDDQQWDILINFNNICLACSRLPSVCISDPCQHVYHRHADHCCPMIQQPVCNRSCKMSFPSPYWSDQRQAVHSLERLIVHQLPCVYRACPVCFLVLACGLKCLKCPFQKSLVHPGLADDLPDSLFHSSLLIQSGSFFFSLPLLFFQIPQMLLHSFTVAVNRMCFFIRVPLDYTVSEVPAFPVLQLPAVWAWHRIRSFRNPMLCFRIIRSDTPFTSCRCFALRL